MAHFAQLDDTDNVVQVIVVSNEDILDEHGKESEEVGIRFLRKTFGPATRWVQTSYNHNFRRRYAGIGMKYDAMLDVFLYPQPSTDYVLNKETLEWELP